MTDNFKLLSDSEHIRKRFSMYGGSQVVQQELTFVNAEFTKVNIVGGLLKVINEIIDNSVDEYVRTKGKYATRIDVDIEADGTIIVSDNGRGIRCLCWNGIHSSRSFRSCTRCWGFILNHFINTYQSVVN